MYYLIIVRLSRLFRIAASYKRRMEKHDYCRDLKARGYDCNFIALSSPARRESAKIIKEISSSKPAVNNVEKGFNLQQRLPLRMLVSQRAKRELENESDNPASLSQAVKDFLYNPRNTFQLNFEQCNKDVKRTKRRVISSSIKTLLKNSYVQDCRFPLHITNPTLNKIDDAFEHDSYQSKSVHNLESQESFLFPNIHEGVDNDETFPLTKVDLSQEQYSKWDTSQLVMPKKNFPLCSTSTNTINYSCLDIIETATTVSSQETNSYESFKDSIDLQVRSPEFEWAPLSNEFTEKSYQI